MPLTRWHCEHAWTGGANAAADVLIECEGDRIRTVTEGVPAPPDARRLDGLVLPGFANTHSHCFHRALRGRTQRGRSSFWDWRQAMYALAERLQPRSYHALARAVFAEMALAGVTCVGEFHYLHHSEDGRPYADPNLLGQAVIAAAGAAGIRISLLDTCYLAAGPGQPLEGVQRRFGDGDAQAWGARVDALAGSPTARIGAAIHSVRAVPADQLGQVAAWAAERHAPLHLHLSEQRAENMACQQANGCSPTALVARHGVLGDRTTAVHATHLDAADIGLLGSTRTTVCMCPTTERDLADGIGPARSLASAGAPMTLGSDSNSVVDPLEEARALELDERLRSEERGNWSAAELLRAATTAGHAALGWADAGTLAPGSLADLVAVDLGGTRLAGAEGDVLNAVVFAGTAADIRDVIVGGRVVVQGRRHLGVEDVPAALRESIRAVLG
ncbi:MAG: formimidoylglutamate deiminase [Candidatus Dormibacteria bacterium]